MRPDRDVTVLNGNLVPTGALTACPASAVATLGVIRPVQVWCGGLLGHDGAHEFRLTWTDPASPVVAPSATQPEPNVCPLCRHDHGRDNWPLCVCSCRWVAPSATDEGGGDRG